MSIRILLTGINGQLGWELQRSLQGLGEIFALDRARLNLEDPDQIRPIVRKIAPHFIINSAAYTTVDRAEQELELAMRINAEAPAILAEECKRLGAVLIHYSTDYVFDGQKPTAYVETDLPNPVNHYGKSKWQGEENIRAIDSAHLILRTSWVYGTRGHNFLMTILRLARERPLLNIVADQYGAPTWCRTIADLTAHIIAKNLPGNPKRPDGTCLLDLDQWKAQSGIYHLSARGRTSWHEFAQTIINQALPASKPQNHAMHPAVQAISTAEYPTPAKRPQNSLLDTQKLCTQFGLMLPEWQDSLQLCLKNLN